MIFLRARAVFVGSHVYRWTPAVEQPWVRHDGTTGLRDLLMRAQLSITPKTWFLGAVFITHGLSLQLPGRGSVFVQMHCDIRTLHAVRAFQRRFKRARSRGRVLALLPK